MRAITKKVLVRTLIVFLTVVISYYVFFYFYLQSQGYIPKVTMLGDITIEKSLLGNKISAPSYVPLQDIFAVATELGGFRVYYPTSLTDIIIVDRNSIWVSGSDNIAFYDLVGMESTSSLIYVMQKPIRLGEENSILSRRERLQSKQNFLSNKCTGGITQATATNTFAHLICSTEENVAIWLRTNSFDLDTLVSIAESMR
jgi:hypothetical protein